jgi:hypothetical protein
MSEESGTPAELETLPWHKVWSQALTKPSVETYERLIRDPNATPFKAVLWVFVAAMIGYGAVVALIFGGDLLSASFWEVGSLCFFPPLGLSFVSLAVFVVSVGVIHLIARALGGTGTYSQMLYAFGAFFAPLIFLAAVANLVPYMQWAVGIAVLVFRVLLGIRAVQAVHGFEGWGKAFASTVPVFVGVFVLVAVTVIIILAVLGSTMGFFPDIVQALEPETGP